MPTSPLKRQSGGGGGRLRRLLASLRPPAPLPVQTGFPTSLADIVVKNHGRLRIPRRRRRAAVPPPAAAAEPPAPVSSQSQQRSELSVADDAASQAPTPAPAPARPGRGAASLSIRPGILLAAGGAVALTLLVIWSKKVVAAATLASVALSWIESASTVRARRRPEPNEEICRDATEPPRPKSCGESESDNAAPLRSAADDTSCGGDTSAPVENTKPKQSRRRSLRKLLASKLRNNGKTARGKDDSRRGGDREHERPETPRGLNAEAGAAAAAAAAAAGPDKTATSLPEAITDGDELCLCQGHRRRRRGGAFPLPALVPIVLAGLVAGGKLPALALAVLCIAFFSSADRVPVPDSGDAILR